MIYSWEKGFIEDKEQENTQSPKKTILRKDELRKSGQALTKPLKGKISTETGLTVKTLTGSNYRKSDIAQAKISLQQEKTRSKSRNPSAEPHMKLQRINSPEILEDIDSDEELRRAVEQADFVNPVDRFQQNQTVITSKDTEAGGGLLSIKRAKPYTAGPSSIPGPKTQEEVALKKSEKKTKTKKPDDKPEKSPKQTATAVDQSNEQSTSSLDTSNKDVQSSSTPKNKQRAKLKKIDSETRPKDILDTFQNRNLAPA